MPADTYMGLAPSLFNRPTAKTANYTVKAGDDAGAILVANGGAALTFTLPAVADVPDGWYCTFLNAAAQNMAITAPSGKLLSFNNTGATTATFSTANNLVGSAFYVVFSKALNTYIGINESPNTVTLS